MKIEFERTGGFAGMKLQAAFDTETLPPQQAVELRARVAAADFFHLPNAISASPPGADRFVYRVTVEEAGRRHTVQAAEAVAPETLRLLLQQLAQLTRAAR